MSLEPIQVRRGDLYEAVWSEPVIKVAARYGITGTGLAKICRRASIPVPPVGYWQRLQHGYAPHRLPLPPLREGTQPVITIENPRPKLAPSPAVAAQLASEEDARNRIRVAERLARPHPLVRMTAQALRGQKTDTWGMLSRPGREKCLDIRVARESLPRALRIMDALLKALAARGFRASVKDGEEAGTVVELPEENVAIALEEKTRRQDHVLTKEESERKAKYGWSSAPRWDYEPTGSLQLRIKEVWGDGVRKTWSDGKRRIEDALNDAVAGMIVVADAKRQHRIDLERRRREWAEAERRRLELEQQRREEAERLKALEQEAAAWARSQQLRAYIDAVQEEALRLGASAEPGGQLHRWLEWARRHADRTDPLKALGNGSVF